VVAAGSAGVRRWTGSTWAPLGGSMNGVSDLIVRPNGELWAGGGVTGSGASAMARIERWTGSAWALVGSSSPPNPLKLTNLPNGDLLITGAFASVSGVPMARMARWNGSTWAPLVAGNGLNTVWASAIDRAGDLVFGGQFVMADNQVSAFLARLRSTCPPLATNSGAGCPSSGGANQLVASTNPWLGSTFTATASGVPTLAIVARVTGFAPLQLPLSLLLPTGVVGCDLRATPDWIDLGLSTNGTTTSTIGLPNSPSLAGVSLHHQFVPFELDAGGNIVAVTATNALQLTLGTL